MYFKLTRRVLKRLIEMYHERTCLWQVKHENYKNNSLKGRAYKEMTLFLRENGFREASIRTVKDKIQNLRRTMRKEKNRIDESGGTYSPSLWYYDLLSFVNDQDELSVSVKEEDCSIDENAQEFIAVETIVEEQESNDDDSINNIIIKREKNNITMSDDDIASTNTLSNNKPDEFEALGINIAAKMKRMDRTQQIYAELLIQKVMAKGLLKQLNGATDLIGAGN